jgi:hypothetical protein
LVGLKLTQRSIFQFLYVKEYSPFDHFRLLIAKRGTTIDLWDRFDSVDGITVNIDIGAKLMFDVDEPMFGNNQLVAELAHIART